MSNNNEAYLSIDIETSGPNPYTYSLLSIGACHVFEPEKTFYAELKPVNAHQVPSALEISGLDWAQLEKEGLPPKEAMARFANWVAQFAQEGYQPVFTAFNAPFDWMFVNDYFHRYLGYNPFGHKALDIKAFYMGLHQVSWQETGMRHLSKHYLANQNLSHHALQDALDQATIFRGMLADIE